MGIKLKLSGIENFVRNEEYAKIQPAVKMASDLLYSGKGAGNDYIGWVDLPNNYDKDEFERIKKAAKKIQSNSEVLIVIGIGGSYLGGRAALEFVNGVNFNKKVHKGIPEVYFVGNSISSDYLSDIIEILGDRDFSINVISKSGTTTEPAIAFRIFKKIIEDKYGKEGARTIVGNCEYWIFLSSDLDTRKMISEEIGDYTTMSNSESNSYNGTRLFDMTGANISASRNLMGRRLLKPEELSLIERPEVLIVGSRPVIMHAYDLAKTPFNKMFGLGNVKHNTDVRAERYNRRKTEKINAVVELWGIWRKYKKPAPRRSVFTDKNINMGEKIFK